MNTIQATHGASTPVRSREEVARFIERQFAIPHRIEVEGRRGPKYKYGVVDLRDLLDFIFGGPPANDAENLKPKNHSGRRT